MGALKDCLRTYEKGGQPGDPPGNPPLGTQEGYLPPEVSFSPCGQIFDVIDVIFLESLSPLYS